MLELSPTMFNIVIGVVGLLLYLFLWRVTRDLPAAARITARLSLALIAIVPVILAFFFGAEGPRKEEAPRAGAPRPMVVQPAEEQARRETAEASKRAAEVSERRLQEERQRIAAERDRAAKELEQSRERQRQVADVPAAAPPPAAAPAPAAPSSPPVAAAPVPVAPTARPPAPVASAEPPRSEPRAANGAPPPVGGTRGAGTPSSEGPWDIVPVFFGTDRGDESGPTRVSFNAERGKRLQLGQALVTVPKKHEVPQVERPWVYRIPFTSIVIHREQEDPRLHFTMKEVRLLSKADLISAVKARLATSESFKGHAVVFIHGFNTAFDYAIFRTAQIAYDLKFDGAPFSYSWPSKGAFGVQDYAYDRESAQQTEPYLKEFLEMVIRESGASHVSIIAHSMGNQALFPVLRELRRQMPDGVVLSQLILAAPDVDRDGFEFLASQFKGLSRGVTLFAASNDRAMVASRRFWGNVPRAGDVPDGGPVIVAGIDTIDVTAINTDIVATNHSGYAEKAALLNDIQLLIQTGERPPERRIPILERVPTPRGDYWRYPPPR
jgi:esterase/lipase superfamily enzyme